MSSREAGLSLLLFPLVVWPMHEGTLNAQWARADLESLKYEKNKCRPSILLTEPETVKTTESLSS